MHVDDGDGVALVEDDALAETVEQGVADRELPADIVRPLIDRAEGESADITAAIGDDRGAVRVAEIGIGKSDSAAAGKRRAILAGR